MKCISLWQPWATLVILGEKRIETRTWRTTFQGQRIAIHAAKRWNKYARRTCLTEPFLSTLIARGFQPENLHNELPFGAIIGTVWLDRCEYIHINKKLPNSTKEIQFGHYDVGRYMWFLDSPAPILKPIFYKGKQGVFEIPDLVQCITCQHYAFDFDGDPYCHKNTEMDVSEPKKEKFCELAACID